MYKKHFPRLLNRDFINGKKVNGKMKKLFVAILVLTLSICLLSACGNNKNSAETSDSKAAQTPKALTNDMVENAAKDYLDNIVDNDFVLVSKGTMPTNPLDKEDFYSVIKSHTLDPITDIPKHVKSELKKFIGEELDKEFETVTYEITNIAIENNKATVEFEIDAPDVGRFAMTQFEYSKYSTPAYAENFKKAFETTKNDETYIKRRPVSGKLIVEYINGNLEIKKFES